MTKDDLSILGLVQQEEKNYSAFSVDLKVWKDGIPFKPGDDFPTKEMKDRANTNKTFGMLAASKLGPVIPRFASDMPDLSPFDVAKAQSINSGLPLFGIILSSYVSLIRPSFKGVTVNGQDRPDIWEGMEVYLENIIKNMFTCCDRATLVRKHNDRVDISVYTDKNIVLFRTKEDERVVTITNVVSDENGKRLECISYMPDGKCVKDVFKYSGNKIGKHITDNELIDEGRYIYFAKNGENNADYGDPELVKTVPAALGVIEAYKTYLRCTMQAKEEIKQLPSGALRKDPVTGMTSYIANGVITYNENNPDIKTDINLIRSNINFEGIIKTLEQAWKELSNASRLSGVILGYERISGNASGRLLLASCIPTVKAVEEYIVRLTPEIKSLIVEIAKFSGEDVSTADVELTIESPELTLAQILDGAESLEATTEESEQTTEQV